MPLDAVCLQAVVSELQPKLLGVRIDKVQQPAKDQVILLLRGNLRLLLNAGANSPRIQLTEQQRDNPAEPPMFCMLLRKHLVGARIANLKQPKLERLVEIDLDITDDLGQPGKRTLVLEAMGRRSNLILLDEERRIIDCLRRVDLEMSVQRQVLPGLFMSFRLPLTNAACQTQPRRSLLPAGGDQSRKAGGRIFAGPLLWPVTIGCQGTDLSRFRTDGYPDFELQPGEAAELWRQIDWLVNLIKENSFTPVGLLKDGKPMEFSYLPIEQYGSLVESRSYVAFSELMDDFYAAREREERIRQRGADLIRTATTVRDRLRRKLALQERLCRDAGSGITAGLRRPDHRKSLPNGTGTGPVHH